jgi:hypothetical protein
MAELADAPGTIPLARVRPRFGADRAWLTVLAAVTVAELAWWLVSWSLGYAPAPFLSSYLAAAFGALACATLLRKLLTPRAPGPAWASVLPATALVGAGASLFLPLKYAIPRWIPFWLDPPLAKAERALLGADPWRVLDHLFGWAAVPLDGLYGLWLPTQALVLFMVILQPASPAKSRALITYVLAWLILGVVAATLLSSAGPIFYDRLFGGQAFAALPEALRHRGAWVALAESDRMWASLASARPGLVAGISAVPSIHVAVSVWIFLAARTLAPRAAPLALGYAAVIWLGSVQLGWHYASDGLAGALGMLALWALSGKIEGGLAVRPDRTPPTCW